MPAEAAVLPTHTSALFAQAVERASILLRAGEVVALPTETVYGLAANALDPRAVARIFAIKGRPAHNPIIVHVASIEMARKCVASWTDLAQRFANAFWPGPLTLVLHRDKVIPDIVTAGGVTVGIRWPSHPFIKEVIKACGFPLAAPSANKSNQISPTNAGHVQRHLARDIPLIVDGGQCQVGIESTVLDLSVTPPCLLRPGMVHEPALLSVAGQLQIAKEVQGGLKSPGLLRRHYSPKARLELWSWASDDDLSDRAGRSGVSLAQIHVVAHTRIPSISHFGRISVIPHDPEAFARAIYSELHECDELGARLIVIEGLPQTPEWHAIADRLRRASAA